MIGWLVVLAAAQDEPEVPAPAPVASMFNADRVVVSTFQPETPDTEADAARLYQLLVERLGRSNELVPMSDVPRFMPQDYGADAYMDGCPPGKYAGCQLVIGQRVDTDRVIGATVRREADEFEDGKFLLILAIHLVDVAEAREIASFGLPVAAGREADTIDGIARLFDDVVRGDYELRDLRPEGPSADDLALEKERTERLATSLAALESELGTAVRTGVGGLIRPPRVSRDDLDDWEDHEETPPWLRLGMTEGQYVRFANSGQDAVTWRRDGQGRFGKVLVRVSGGVGGGPWHQSYTGQVLLSDQDLQPVDAVQVLEVRNASSVGLDLEVGFGVTPFLDLAVTAAVRTGSTSYALDEDVQNQIAIPTTSHTYAMSTWQEGFRAQFAPFPRWTARPTVGVGLAFWSGAGIPESYRFPRVDPPSAMLLEVLPGVEADATPIVALSLRALLSQPLIRDYVIQTEVGTPLIPDPPRALRDTSLGFGVQAGIVVRIGPVWGEKAPVRGGATFEDDEP